MNPAPLVLLLLSALAASFWETKAPADWTDDELIRLFTDSPWSQMAGATAAKDSHSAPVQIYFATAGPMQLGDQQRKLRYLRKRNDESPPESPMDTEYRLWLEDNRATQIVLAVRINRRQDFEEAGETKRMEEESVLRVGRKKIKMSGHFPPTANDAYLRMAFPREVQASDKIVTFELYLPGVSPPYRTVEFKVKDMIVNGKLEM